MRKTIKKLTGKQRELLTEIVRETISRERKLETALSESLKLQSHYANLLNMHDGGARIGFDSIEAWLTRLEETGKI